MAQTIQRGLFATHRGRIVKRSFLGLAALCVGLTLATNAANSGPRQAEAPVVVEAVSPIGGSADPVVVSAVANPFQAEQASYYQVGGAPEGEVVDPGVVAEPVESSASSGPVGNESVQIRQSAQAFAAKWATYSESQGAAAYVAALPGVAPEAADALAAATEADWAGRFDQGSILIGTLTGATPVVRSFDAAAGTARVDVAVDQEALDSLDAQSVKSITVQVDMVRYQADGGAKWGVTTAKVV